MRRPLKLGIGLILLAALLGGYLYLVNRPEESPDTATAVVERIELVEAGERELVGIEVAGEAAAGYVMERAEEAWLIDVPWQAELNQAQLTRIARSSASLTADRLLEENPGDLDQYGLAEPKLNLALRFDDGSSQEFEIGIPTPSGTKRYLKKSGENAVYTVSNYYLGAYFQDPDDFRIKSMAGINPQELGYFRIEGPEETIELVPVDSLSEKPSGSILSGLVMVAPVGPRGIDSQAFGELAQTIPAAFTAAEIIDEPEADLSRYGLEDPEYRVRLSGGESNLAFDVGGSDGAGNRYVRFEGEERILTLPPSQLSFLETDSFALMEKFVLIINIDDVDSIAIRHNGDEHIARIERSGEGDAETETYFVDGEEIEEDAFKDFYQDLIGIVADAPNRGEPDSGEAELVVEYRLNTPGKSRLRASFVPVDRDFYAAYRDGQSLFLISAQQIERAIASLSALVSD